MAGAAAREQTREGDRQIKEEDKWRMGVFDTWAKMYLIYQTGTTWQQNTQDQSRGGQRDSRTHTNTCSQTDKNRAKYTA